jgi:hypothetical protein
MLKREGETLQVVSMEGLVWIVVGALAATVILGKQVFILPFPQSACCETRLSSQLKISRSKDDSVQLFGHRNYKCPKIAKFHNFFKQIRNSILILPLFTVQAVS